ncbi:MAG TPA: DUF922 domain-containing protein [Anaerolineae bacterium]|nr:DUF922 domain-containing protein [Anaerolineae bacterium]
MRLTVPLAVARHFPWLAVGLRAVRPVLCAAAALLAACAGGPATSSPAGYPLPTLVPIDLLQATVQPYDVGGSTELEMRAQLNAYGPRGHDAYTQWSVRWDWPGRGTATCRLSEAEASYEITVTFPRWIPPADAPPELVAKWNGYLHALALHENGHIGNIVSRFPTVVTAIKSSTCLTAEAAAQAVLHQLRQLDSQYDLDTQHGEAQGVRFP